MATDRGSRKDKNQNIQVFVRLRPINQRERDIKSLGVVEVVNNKEVVVRQSAQTNLTKKFTFDRAFGPNAKQVEVYQEVVSPLIEEVLAGYNCTVFAYGQTGTGKTHTMVGEYTDDQSSWQSDPLAGIIPRVLSQLFDELRLSNTEFTVRVSYLELYNEELFDLLSTSDDNSKLRIYEDVTRKGANIVNGLEEITVYNKKEVYKIMAQGQDRKRVASTLMNAQSSNEPNGKLMNDFRSHTVFTIVVHMKENSPEGEELVKIGKLNLVDLAGSENISKAGSEGKKERARECVNINQSLLTLGRVITALVERHPHIPYRESKLTRILQESLGGRTKTSIIATVSPGHKDLEETMSTLEYAHRAKNIQNKPEVNQKMTKKAILKEFAEEIDRLKRDLQASRDKNGVYLANETYLDMTFKAEEQNKEIQNLILQKRAIEEERDKMETIFKELNQTIKEKENKLETTKNVLNETKSKLCQTKNALQSTSMKFEEQKHLVSKQVETETVLTEQANTLLQTAELATNHVDCLLNTVDKRKQVEHKNVEVRGAFREQAARLCADVCAGAGTHADTLTQRLHHLWNLQENFSSTTTESQKDNIQKVDELVRLNMDAMDKIKDHTKQSEMQLIEKTEESKVNIQKDLTDNSSSLQSLMDKFVSDLSQKVENAKNLDAKGRKILDNFVQEWSKGAGSRVAELVIMQGRQCEEFVSVRDRAADHVTHVHDTAIQLATQRRRAVELYGEIIEKEKDHLEKQLMNKLKGIHEERAVAHQRMDQWLEDEIDRLKIYVKEEKDYLETKLTAKATSIQRERFTIHDRVQKFRDWKKTQEEDIEKEIALAEFLKLGYEKNSHHLDVLTNKYNRQFLEGTNAISVDMEALTQSVTDIVDHNHTEIMKGVSDVQEHVQSAVSEVILSHKECSSQLQNTSNVLLQQVLDITQNTTKDIISHAEKYNETAITNLSSVSSSLLNNVSISLAHTQAIQSILDDTKRDVTDHAQNVQDIVEMYKQVENKFLGEEFKIYSPTGKTPLRQQYRYPRVLAATSPHERILARYRDSRNDDDVIIIESACQSPTGSESETSLSSEHTEHNFTVPTPKTNGQVLTKSTSETDIYAIRNCKENTEQYSGSLKKPSKLPMSQKKPLSERNTSVN